MDWSINIARNFRTNLDEFMQNCDKVNDYNGCYDCPLCKNCLKEETIEDIWSNVSVERLASFLEYANVIDEPEMTEEDYEGRWADEQRGIDRDLAEMN